MKKILLTAVLFSSLNAFAQDEVEVSAAENVQVEATQVEVSAAENVQVEATQIETKKGVCASCKGAVSSAATKTVAVLKNNKVVVGSVIVLGVAAYVAYKFQAEIKKALGL